MGEPASQLNVLAKAWMLAIGPFTRYLRPAEDKETNECEPHASVAEWEQSSRWTAKHADAAGSRNSGATHSRDQSSQRTGPAAKSANKAKRREGKSNNALVGRVHVHGHFRQRRVLRALLAPHLRGEGKSAKG
jgi:hypothetical protein